MGMTWHAGHGPAAMMGRSCGARPGGRNRRGHWLHGLGLALLLANCDVAGMPVEEHGPALVQQLLNQINTYQSRIQQAAQYVKDNAYWLKLLQQYRDALVQVQGIVNSFSLAPGARLERVDARYLVAETCGRDRPDLVDVLGRLVFDSNGDWKAQQNAICVSIRMMRNRKYNDTVDFIKDTVPRISGSLEAITRLRNSSRLLGNITAVDSDSLRTANDLAASTQEWQARMQAYDAYIEVMEANQKALAQQALRGRAHPLAGDLARTALLRAALAVD